MQRLGVIGRQSQRGLQRRNGIRGEPSTKHGVVNPFAGGRRHNARGIPGEQDVPSIVPAAQRSQRNGSTFLTYRFGIFEPGETPNPLPSTSLANRNDRHWLPLNFPDKYKFAQIS